MGWLIAIGILQLIVLVYIAYHIELLLRGDSFIQAANLIIDALHEIRDRR